MLNRICPVRPQKGHILYSVMELFSLRHSSLQGNPGQDGAPGRDGPPGPKVSAITHSYIGILSNQVIWHEMYFIIHFLFFL